LEESGNQKILEKTQKIINQSRPLQAIQKKTEKQKIIAIMQILLFFFSSSKKAANY
jgi:hypothetical protein